MSSACGDSAGPVEARATTPRPTCRQSAAHTQYSHSTQEWHACRHRGARVAHAVPVRKHALVPCVHPSFPATTPRLASPLGSVDTHQPAHTAASAGADQRLWLVSTRAADTMTLGPCLARASSHRAPWTGSYPTHPAAALPLTTSASESSRCLRLAPIHTCGQAARRGSRRVPA